MTDAPVFDDAVKHALQFDGDATQQSQFFDYVKRHLHLPRGIAIGVVGLAIGAGLGLASLSWRRALNGAIGGIIGGFVGGVPFRLHRRRRRMVPAPGRHRPDRPPNRLDDRPRSRWLDATHWLEIVSGGMAGKQFILYHQETVVGSAADVAITLIKDPATSLPGRPSLRREGPVLSVTALDASYPVLVNGASVATQRLNDGDLLQFGSSIVRYRAKEAVAPVSAQIYG